MLLAAGLYVRTVVFDFVNLDDPFYISNTHIGRGITTGGFFWAITSLDVYWQPLTWVSHMLDIELFGLNAGAHHLMNALLQSMTGGLLFLLVYRITGKLYRSMAVVAIWALHPLRVESVAWVSERKDVLSGLFGVATLIVWQSYIKVSNLKRYVMALLLFGLALMSKPTLVVLPVVLIALDTWPFDRNWPWQVRLIEKAPFFAMSGAIGILTVIGQRKAGALALLSNPFSFQLKNAIVSTVAYLGQMAYPVGLSAFYPYPKEIPVTAVAFCAILLLSLTVLTIWQRRQRPYLIVGWFWYLVMLLPTIGLIQAGRQSRGDRFTYWPMIGIVLASVWLVAEWLESRPTWRNRVVWCTGALVFALAFTSWHQIGYWRDSITLFEHALSAGGDNEYIRGNLATSLMEKGRYQDAEDNLLAALRIAPYREDHRHNLALVELKLGKLEEARTAAAATVLLAPQDANMYGVLAAIDLRQGRYDLALNEMGSAVQRGYDRKEAAIRLNDASVSLAQRREFQSAEALLRGAIGFEPRLVEAQKNLILVLMDTGRKEVARQQLNAALAIAGPHPSLQAIAEHL